MAIGPPRWTRGRTAAAKASGRLPLLFDGVLVGAEAQREGVLFDEAVVIIEGPLTDGPAVGGETLLLDGQN